MAMEIEIGMDFGSITKQIRQASRSTKNRLHSILYDSTWVKEVGEAFGLPLIPNERCGLWYVEPENIKETSYFKSTDGHITQWSFSTRRLNFHLFQIIIENKGIVIVDSTRRGKTIPDALSKTIPIWCATLNYVMFQEKSPRDDNWCFLPQQIISKSEASSIIALIPIFAQQLLDLKIISVEVLSRQFNGKYLRPIWIYPNLSLPFEPPQYEDFYPIVCCVASMRADDGAKKLDGFIYVQGAADDHELWASNLNPKLFWQNIDQLKDLSLSDEQLLQFIHDLKIENSDTVNGVSDIVKLTDKLYIGKIIDNLKEQDIDGFNTIIILSTQFDFVFSTEKLNLLSYKISSNKKGSNDLRRHLPQILETINTNFTSNGPSLILCETGTDLSIGVALATLSLNYNTSWEESENQIITKDVIKRHLAKVLQLKKVNPSRATLQSINSFLM